MDVTELIAHHDVAEVRTQLEQLSRMDAARVLHPRCKSPDVFINIVLQGGGTLGIAHVGVLYALELLRVHVVGVAGTSAGAIAALLIAAARGDDIEKPYARELLDVLGSMPSHEFIDGPYLVRRLIKELLLARSLNPIELSSPAWSAAWRLLATNGLNPGTAFLEWLRAVLADRFQVKTIEDLRGRLSGALANAKRHCARDDSANGVEPFDGLQMIATGIPQGLKVVFPREHVLFDLDTTSESPAIFARASMSIPFFFDPLRLPPRKDAWRRTLESDASFRRMFDEEDLTELARLDYIRFVDGGVLSNFPIDAFTARKARNWLQRLPTIGFSMISRQQEMLEETAPAERGFAGLTSLCTQMFSATRALRDREARSACHSPSRIAFIDTGEHNWLNFMLDDDSARDLFVRGMRSVVQLVTSTERAHNGGQRVQV